MRCLFDEGVSQGLSSTDKSQQSKIKPEQNKSNAETESQIETVKIGTQIWMTRNLDIDHYRNGDLIPEVTDQDEWVNLTSGAWCCYDNDPANSEIYGKLYNWFTVNDPRGLAPDGWHIPTDTEWKTLAGFLGGEAVAGKKCIPSTVDGLNLIKVLKGTLK